MAGRGRTRLIVVAALLASAVGAVALAASTPLEPLEGERAAARRTRERLEDLPLLPIGPRRSLLPVLPGLFLGIGVFGALFGLIPGVTQLGDAGNAVTSVAGMPLFSRPP